MKQISLSIEELIYCFYSEGYFEQGNALKQVYFGDLDDEKMELLLQIACRSLLAKSLVHYQNHKFTLIQNLARVISILNFSEQSIKASRHREGEGEESLSFHFGEKMMIQHSLLYDEQVHVFTPVTKKEIVTAISDFYRVGKDGEKHVSSISMTQEEFEQQLSALNDSNFTLSVLPQEKMAFHQILQKTNGLLNTLLFLEFNEEKEPLAKNIVMFTNKKENNWVIEKQDDLFTMCPCSEKMIDLLLENNVFTSIEIKEEELTHHGK